MPEIEIKGLTKRFGDYAAVKRIDVSAERGEMLTLLGPSGCGKTTTLRMIAGLEDPSEGTIEIASRVMYDSARKINTPSEQRGLGMVFQSYAIWPHMTVAENIAYPLRMRRVPKAERGPLVNRVLDMVGLAGLGDKSATKLSGGQQQRVAFARALVFEPSLLLLDEPLSNLDAKLREHMRFELKTMKRRLGLTSIYVTHDQEEALTLSDRVVVMNNGLIEQIGSPQDIYARPKTRFVAQFIGKANMVAVDSGPDYRPDSVGVSLRTKNGEVRFGVALDAVRRPVQDQPPGDPAHIFIRPEHITIASSTSNSDGTICIPGTIRERAYVGDHDEFLIEVNDDVTMRVSAPSGLDRQVGDAVFMSVATRDVVLYS